MFDIDSLDFDLPAFRDVHQCHRNCLIEASWPAAAGIEKQCVSHTLHLIPVSVTDYYEVERVQISGQAFFLVGHVNVDASNLLIDEQRQFGRPLFIIVSSYNVEGGDGGQGVQNALVVDVAAVEDGIATLEVVLYLLAQEAVRIRKDTEFHIHHSNKNFAMARL